MSSICIRTTSLDDGISQWKSNYYKIIRGPDMSHLGDREEVGRRRRDGSLMRDKEMQKQIKRNRQKK